MQPTMIDGKMVHIRQISTTDEGVLYTHAISVSLCMRRCLFEGCCCLLSLCIVHYDYLLTSLYALPPANDHDPLSIYL